MLCSFIPTGNTPPANMQEVHEKFVTSFFVVYEEDAKDKSLFLKLKPYPEEPEKNYFLQDFCPNVMGTTGIYGAFQRAIDENADYGWYGWYGDSFFKNYKRLLNVNLIKKRVELKNGTKFNHFDALALEKTFQAMYKKPTEKFKGLFTYQRIYDVSAKKAFAECADFIAEVMKNKKGFEKVANEYKQNMESEEFYGASLPEKTWENIFDKSKLVEDGEYYYYNFEKNCGYGNDLMLMMVRRNIDGTLPTILKLFKQILQDYDKTTFEKYKDKF
jgi:hypothetical protein